MPWCPKCKSEYTEGTKECVNCKVELVENLEKKKAIIFGDAEEMEKLKAFLEYNEIQNVEVSFNAEDNTYELFVEETAEKKAKKLTSVFLKEELQKKGNDDENADEQKTVSYNPVYQNSAAKAEDNRSSAFTLLLVGGVGIIIIILCMTGVISLNLSTTSKYMVYGVMGALFILFLVMGIVSMRSSKIFALKAQKEDSLTEEITNWCLADLNAEMIDEMISQEDGKEETAEELKYFKRTEKMKKLINEKFLNLDEAYLEHILDDIYAGIFEQDQEEENV